MFKLKIKVKNSNDAIEAISQAHKKILESNLPSNVKTFLNEQIEINLKQLSKAFDYKSVKRLDTGRVIEGDDYRIFISASNDNRSLFEKIRNIFN